MSNLVPPGIPLPDAIALLQQVVADRQTSKMVQTAALTIMIYDNMLTLPQEASATSPLYVVDCKLEHQASVIWGSRWTKGKVLFLITRWPVVLESLLYLIYSFGRSLPLWLCNMETNLASWSVLIFLIPLQIVIVLRTIALWHESRFVFYLLTSCAIATDVALVGLLANVSKNELHFSPDPQLQPTFGCYADVTTFDPKVSTAGWSATMLFDFVIFALTFVRSLSVANHTRSPLLRVLIMDGFAYYCVMLVVSILALTFSVALDIRRELLFAMVPPIFKACYCILGSRIAIRLRESYMSTIVRTCNSQITGRGEGIELTSLGIASMLPEESVGSATAGG